MITLEFLRDLDPCYDPETIGFTEDLNLTPLQFIEQFEDKVKSKSDIIWLLCRPEFMNDRDLRLFGVWCAREALKLQSKPDKRSVLACDVAERFANGEATHEELKIAEREAWNAADAQIVWIVARASARASASARAAAAAAAAAASARASAAAAAAASARARVAAAAAARARTAERAAAAAALGSQIERLKEFFR